MYTQKKSIFTFLIVTLFFCNLNAQFISGENDRFQFTIWSDVGSAVEEHKFPHTGAEITYIPGAAWVSASFSYFDLEPSYFDFIFSVGLNINLFHYEPIRYYGGARIGAEFREAPDGLGIAGAVLGAEWEIGNSGLAIGYRFWVDWRESQDNDKYGDSDAYDPGILIKHPNTQENSAVTLSWVW